MKNCFDNNHAWVCFNMFVSNSLDVSAWWGSQYKLYKIKSKCYRLCQLTLRASQRHSQSLSQVTSRKLLEGWTMKHNQLMWFEAFRIPCLGISWRLARLRPFTHCDKNSLHKEHQGVKNVWLVHGSRGVSPSRWEGVLGQSSSHYDMVARRQWWKSKKPGEKTAPKPCTQRHTSWETHFILLKYPIIAWDHPGIDLELSQSNYLWKHPHTHTRSMTF